MFIAVVLYTSGIIGILATLLWKQVKNNRKKRQQRIRSLSSRLPKLQSSSPQSLEQRRLAILSGSKKNSKHLGVTNTANENVGEMEQTTPRSISPLKNEISVCPPSSPFPPQILPLSELHTDTDGYEKLEQHENDEAPSVLPVLDHTEESAPERFSFNCCNERPSLLPMPVNNGTNSTRGYSLLATFLKKKKTKKAIKAYSIFTGKDGSQEVPTSPIRDDDSDLSPVEEEEVLPSPMESLSASLRFGKLPDSYKYISKDPSAKKLAQAYRNPYQLAGDINSQCEHKIEAKETEEIYDVLSESPYTTTPFDLPDDDSSDKLPSLHRKKNSTELKRKQAVYKSHSGDKVSTKAVQNGSSQTDHSTMESEGRPRSCTTEGMLRLSEERWRNRDIVPVSDEHDAFDHLLDGVDLHDWNERFQRIMTTIRKFNTNTTIALQIKANRALIHLAQDFIYASSTYGKIIISEVYSAEKTIKPINLGGKLGGTKYIVQNILFKFAVDESGLYSDYAAAKVAGHELKGLINYFNCNIEDLCLPLMSLVDYRGFRLIAMSILPIRGSETIVYGSDNYGETIHNNHPVMAKLLTKSGSMMNIKEHRCGISTATSNSLCSPADLEGHLGTDNRLYLLDFSRVLPPETPVRGIQNAHLYRLLRPEHVKLYEKPLCSDAYSGFIAKFNYAEDNREVDNATKKLINETIPQFAGDLTTMMLEARDKGALESFRLTEAIHRQGINVRYIGLLRKQIKELDPRTFLLIEMSARVVKNKLRKLLRKKMKELKVPLEEPYRRLVISYLNLVLGDSEASEDYWNNNLKKSIQRTFVEGLSKQESNEAYSLKSSLNNFSNDRVDGKLLLFLRLQKMTGLRFTNRINEEFTQNPNNWAPRGAQPLDETDLEDIGLRVKHMNIISHAQGFVLQMKGAMAWAHDPVAAERFYNMAITKYEEALDTNPNDYQALIRCAEIATQFIEGHARGVAAMKYNIEMVSAIRVSGRQMANTPQPQVQYANMLYQRAVTANPKDSYGLYRYAQFLDKCNIPQTAEEMFLRSLEADRENVACLQEYGNFLSENSKHELAELFFVRGSELAQKYSTNENVATSIPVHM